MHLELAEPLKEIARQILAKMGRYYVLRCRLCWDKHQPYRIDEVRKHVGQKHPEYLPVLQHFFSGKDLCRQLIKVFPPGSNLFIASNLWKPYDEEYFGPLRRLYKIHRYYDFPELVTFVTGANPNTAKLFLIEQVLEQHSINKIVINYMGCERAFRSLQKLVNMPESPQLADLLSSKTS